MAASKAATPVPAASRSRCAALDARTRMEQASASDPHAPKRASKSSLRVACVADEEGVGGGRWVFIKSRQHTFQAQ